MGIAGILGTRWDKVPERQCPHYGPEQRRAPTPTFLDQVLDVQRERKRVALMREHRPRSAAPLPVGYTCTTPKLNG